MYESHPALTLEELNVVLVNRSAKDSDYPGDENV